MRISLKTRVAAVQMLRTCCLMCAVEEAHSSLPQTMEHPSHALPWGSALCWPNVPSSECRMDGPEELQSSSFPQIFWESSILETFERRSILEVTVAQEPLFHSTPLGKHVLLSFPFFGEHSLPILTPLLLFSVTPSPPSHMRTHFPVPSLSPYQKNQTDREKLPRVPFLISWRNSCPFSIDPEYQVLPWPMGMEVAVPFISQTCHGTSLRG